MRLFLKLAEKIAGNPLLNIKLTRTNCFAECEKGPVLVVYPEGVWYGHLDETALERIVSEHLQQNKAVSEYVFQPQSGG